MAAGRLPRPLIIALAVLAIAGVVLFALRRSLDSIVRGGLETYGTQVTGTRVSVGAVHLELRDARGEIRAVRIRNPDGFSSADALSLGEVVLDLGAGKLGSEPYVIDEIRVASPSVLVELDERAGTNLDRIRKHVEGYVPATGGGEAKPAPRLIVKRLVFEEGTVRLDARRLGGKETTLELGSVELRDLGGEAGAPADRVAASALRALLREIVEKAAARQLKDAAGGAFREKAQDAVGGLLRKLDG